ncbi:MAG: GHMP kinase [Oligoflexia bacterium]|nr:GHMP kinase [Oligoflexia bacterium]
MILSRTPFRLSFAGGGTDLPSFYNEEEGAVLSTALNKYMHIMVTKRFDQSIRLSYSKTEIKNHASEIEHPIFKSVVNRYAPQGGIEIISMADVPSGTGLGSSSSFTVGLLNALKSYLGKLSTAESLASEACAIEIDELKEPIGKQDQYIAAYGGLQFIRFLPSGEVRVEPVVCSTQKRKALEAHTLLFFTGKTRDAKSVLKEQSENTSAKRQTLREMAAIAKKLRGSLENDQSLENFGRLLHDAWLLKKSVASNVSTQEIDQWYGKAMDAGAWGGKILGAGSGGFLMVFCDPARQAQVREALSELRPFDVEFDTQGSRLLFVG